MTTAAVPSIDPVLGMLGPPQLSEAATAILTRLRLGEDWVTQHYEFAHGTLTNLSAKYETVTQDRNLSAVGRERRVKALAVEAAAAVQDRTDRRTGPDSALGKHEAELRAAIQRAAFNRVLTGDGNRDEARLIDARRVIESAIGKVTRKQRGDKADGAALTAKIAENLGMSDFTPGEVIMLRQAKRGDGLTILAAQDASQLWLDDVAHIRREVVEAAVAELGKARAANAYARLEAIEEIKQAHFTIAMNTRKRAGEIVGQALPKKDAGIQMVGS